MKMKKAKLIAAWNTYAQGWIPTVRKVGEQGDESGTAEVWQAELPFRSIRGEGSSPDEAVATLFRTYCELSRTGAFTPHNPDAKGVPPVQHVLNVLSEMLQGEIHNRNSNREFTYENDMRADDEQSTANTRPGRAAGGAPTWGSAYRDHHVFTRDNQVISGLATAIAALARVKEL